MAKLTRMNDLIDEAKRAKGRWELTPDHEIQYRSQDKDEEFRFKGALIAAEPEALILSFTQKQSDQKTVTRLGRLAGSWSLDGQNRMRFEIEREDGRKEALIFKGAWRIGPKNELIYTYRQEGLKKKKIVRELAFTGFWDLSEDNRLAYWLGGDSDAAFRFRGAFQTGSLLAKKGEIRYQAGAEVSGRHKAQTLVLFGKWKVSRDFGLSFEIEYKEGRKRALVFSAERALSKNTDLSFELKSRAGEPLGVELILESKTRW